MNTYVLGLVVYFMTDAIACWGLNLQFGQAGLYSFGFITCQAVGAYTAGILTLGPQGAGQQYVLGMRLPFPVPMLAACVMGGLMGMCFGVAALKRIRRDYQALALLMIAVIANYLVTGVNGFLNGSIGIAGIPLPLPRLTGSIVGVPSWGYAALCFVALCLSFWIVRALAESPSGRAMRTARGNEAVARATGKPVAKLWLGALFWGGALGGLSGALLAMFIGAWSPGSWEFTETFVFLTALIVGGVGNIYGAALGALLVPVAFTEGSRFLPSIPGEPNLGPALEWILVGLLTVVFLWVRPAGLLRERRHRYSKLLERAASGRDVEDADEAVRDSGASIDTAPRRKGEDAARIAAGRGVGISPETGSMAGDGSVGSVGTWRGGSGSGGSNGIRPPALAVEDVVVRFGGVAALNGVSFSVPEGSVTALVGPNGAGKSTLVGVVAGSVRATSGRVLMFGEDVTHLKSHVLAKRGLARSFQINGEVDGLTVFENIIIGEPHHGGEGILRALAGKRAWRQEEGRVIARAGSELHRVGLRDKADALTSELSGGQRRLMEVARCLVAAPRIVLLDEPMAGVNPRMADTIIDHIRLLKERGLTVLLVEHELEVVEDVADRIVLLADGRTVMEGDAVEVLNTEALREVYIGV